MCTTGLVVVAGEISTKAHVDIPRLVRDTVRGIGYTDARHAASTPTTCAVITSIDEQSPDIAQGVDKALRAARRATATTTTRSARATRA